MQSNPRTLVNVLVILVRILVNSLVKLTRPNPKVRGGAIGAYPSASLSRVYFPPAGGPWGHGPWPMVPMAPRGEGWPCGVPTWSQAHGTPLFGGEYGRERLAGGAGPDGPP